MDFLFIQLFHKYLADFLLNCKYKRAYRDDDKYSFVFSKNILNISLLSGNSICFLSQEKAITKEQDKFTEILNKHLNKSSIKDIILRENDRILYIDLNKKDIYGNELTYRLCIELINYHENIILTRLIDKKWIIQSSANKITFADSSYRQILPSIKYIPPPKLNKPYIFNLSKREFFNTFGNNLPKKWKEFIIHFSNVPKFLKYKFKPELPTLNFWEVILYIQKIWNDLANVKDQNYKNNNTEKINKNFIYYSKLNKYLTFFKEDGNKRFANINDAFEFYYYKKIQKSEFNQKRSKILKRLNKKIKSLLNTIKIEKEELNKMETADKWKKYGELLKIHLPEIKKGQTKIDVEDIFEENSPKITIPLNREYNAPKNMKMYFKKYKKVKSGKIKLHHQINTNLEKLDKLRAKLSEIENIDTIDNLNKYKNNQKFQCPRKVSKSGKKRFRQFSINYEDYDWKILVGRTGKENDELTTKLAKSEDWFFHSRIYHGAHVIVKNERKLKFIPGKVKIFAAGIAAYYSKAKHSKKVPVDYTKVKYVTKPRKSPPGLVIYRNQRTIFVEPLQTREKRQIKE